MPDRAIIPLMTAGAAGFITGVIAAVEEMSGSSAVVLGLIVGVFVALSGALSVVRAPGEESERWVVGLLRGLLAVAAFACLYAGLLKTLRDGSILGIVLIVFAAVFAGILTRLRVRDRGQLETMGGRGQPTA
jgi:uncharacterized membrane protein HdeD (DUF308 family)